MYIGDNEDSYMKNISKKEDIKYPIRIDEEELPEIYILDSNNRWLTNELVVELLNSTNKEVIKCQQ